MSGSTIGSVVGAGIGFAVGGPAGARWGWMIGGLLGGIISPQVVQGAKWNNQQLQGSRDGLPRAVVFGTSTVIGNIMDANPDGPKIGTKKESQGKGGPVVKRDTAILTYAVEICDSSELRGTKVNGVIAVWEDERLVYDLRPGSQLGMADSAKWAENKKFYYGSESQTAAPELEAIHGVGNVPAYRGTCYMTAIDEDLMVDVRGDPRGRIPTYRFLVSQCAIVPTGANFPAFIAHGSSNSTRIITSGAEAVGTTNGKITTLSSQPVTAAGRVGAEAVAVLSDTKAFVTADNVNWLQISNLPYPAAYSSGKKVVEYNGGVYFPGAGTTYTFFRLDMSAKTWSLGNGTTTNYTRLDSFAVADGVLYAIGSSAYVATYSTTDGSTWTARTAPPMTIPKTIVSSGSRLVVGGNTGSVAKIAYSDDNAATWTAATFTGSAPIGIEALEFIGGGKILAISAAGTLWLSKNNGATFEATLVGKTASTNGPAALKYDPASGVTTILTTSGPIQTTDGETSVPVSYSGDTPGSVYVSLAAQSGTPIPDAPGYYVAPDGSIIGPGIGEGTECGANLQTVVRTIHALGAPQLADADFDLSALSGDTVPGFVIQDANLTAADACEPLRKVYMFDLPSFDLKIRAIKRGGSVDLTISPDDVIATKDGYEVFTRGQSIEYPKKLHVGYIDPAIDYKPTTQISERYSSSINVVGEETIDTLLTLTADNAKQAAHKLHKLLWAQLEDSRSLSLPIEYLEIAPASLVDYQGRRYRIDAIRIEGTRIVLDTMSYDRGSIYTSSAIGVPGQAPAPPTGSVRGPTASAYMCLPALRPEDDAPGIYWAASGLLPGWRGATLDISRDSGVSFVDSSVSASSSATMGTIDAALPSSSRYSQDWNNSIDVTLTATSDVLDSVDFAALVSGANAAAIIKPDNTAEIIQWQTAVENAPGQYTLTGLLRGRMNTAPAAHAAGAQFVVLDSTIRFVPLRMTDEGQPITFRAVTDTTNADDNASVTITVTLESLREWAPYCVRSTLDSGTLDATWVGRGRLGSSRAPVQSLRFAEYRLTADDGSTMIIAASPVQSISTSAGPLTSPYTATVAARSALSSIYDSPEGN